MLQIPPLKNTAVHRPSKVIKAMELAVITFWQVVTLFLLIFTGALSVKTGILPKEAKSIFANLLLYVVLPAMVVNSYLVEYSEAMSRSIGQAFLYSALAILAGLAVSLLAHRKQNPARALCQTVRRDPEGAKIFQYIRLHREFQADGAEADECDRRLGPGRGVIGQGVGGIQQRVTPFRRRVPDLAGTAVANIKSITSEPA